MPRRCSICDHPERIRIDQALAVGATAKRRIASQHGITERALYRHARAHLPGRLVKAESASQVADAGRLLGRVDKLVRQLECLAEDATVARRGDALLKVARELRPALELLGKVSGELASNQVNALFLNLGVRDEAELRRRIDLTREVENVTPEEILETALETLQVVFHKQPELAQQALKRIHGFRDRSTPNDWP